MSEEHGAAEPEWDEFFRAGKRHDTLYDVQRRDSIMRWNRWTLIAASGLGSVVVILAVLAIVFDLGIWGRLIVIAVIFAAVTLGVLVPMNLVYRRRVRRETVLQSAFYLGVSAEGVHLAKFPLIRWDELFLVVIGDRSASKKTQLNRPLLGTGAKLSARTGNGWVSLIFALRDADAVIARVSDGDARRFVSTWKQASEPRTGTMSLVPDAVVNPEPLGAMIYALDQGCRFSGTPFQYSTSPREYLNRIGALVDPTWVNPPSRSQ